MCLFVTRKNEQYLKTYFHKIEWKAGRSGRNKKPFLFGKKGQVWGMRAEEPGEPHATGESRVERKLYTGTKSREKKGRGNQERLKKGQNRK